MGVERCPACKRKLKRSSEANRKYWSLLHLMSEKLRPQGRQFAADTLHLWAKSKFLGTVDHVLPGGKVHSEPNSTADLDTAEFSDYFDRVQAFANEQGVYLEDAE